ncbi:MAG: hypothetical protein ABF750_03985 [Oenococcus oeni]
MRRSIRCKTRCPETSFKVQPLPQRTPQASVTIYFKDDQKPKRISKCFYVREDEYGIRIKDKHGSIYRYPWQNFDYYKENYGD